MPGEFQISAKTQFRSRMTSALLAFFGAANNATNILKAVLETRDKIKLGELHLKFTEALLELESHQLSVTQSYQALATENESLKKQIAAYERWDQESQRYELHELAPGIHVYALKQEHASGHPVYWLCAACYNDGKKSMLKPQCKGSDILECPRDTGHWLLLEERGGTF